MIEVTYYSPDQLHLLPHEPGVYQFYKAKEQLLYVGKAKDIKKRVKTYFTGLHSGDIKTRKMVSQIQGITFTIVNSEYEALLLENTLIKAYQPPYNILLKDDKTYPYLCITDEPFPKVMPVRRPMTGQGKYYGPFTDTKTMYRLLDLIKSLYTIRTCTYHLSEQNIAQHKFKVCLQYHIAKCKGPCIGEQSEASYAKDIEQIRYLLEGNFQAIKKKLKASMQQAAKTLDFTNAQADKEKLQAIANYQSKALVAHPRLGDLDVFAMVGDEKRAFVSYLKIRAGCLSFSQTIEVQKKLNESSQDILGLAIVHFRQMHASYAPQILTNIDFTTDFALTKCRVPKIGDKKKLVQMALKNALFFQKEKLKKNEQDSSIPNHVLLAMQKDLKLPALPVHIECFDNSHIQGHSPVGAMVCFKNGKPHKSHYRHFHIQTPALQDDCAFMQEIVFRRYHKILTENEALPDLIIIDGGRGQLNSAIKSLQALNIYGKVAILGIAKRLEELYLPSDRDPLHLNKKSLSLRLLQNIRNEAHRFAIGFHRKIRAKASLDSQLANIPGIGPKTLSVLLQHFGDIMGIRQASIATLTPIIGESKAKKLEQYWNSAKA